jgi:3-oxoacyl-[acyl-carrier-protein] synthase II
VRARLGPRRGLARAEGRQGRDRRVRRVRCRAAPHAHGAQVPALRTERLSPRYSRVDAFALHASAAALAEARLAGRPLGGRAGVFFGTSTAGMLETERWYRDLPRGRSRARQLGAQQSNAPGDAVARRFGVCGPVCSVSTACVSGAQALALALDALRSDEIDVAIAGGADGLCELTHAGFNALRAVDPAPCRPFRADRQGLSLGEGAGVLVLERAGHAAARGGAPLGWLAGAASTCDAHHMSAPDPSGAGAARAITAALEDAGLGPEAIDFVNVHGTGTPLNDAAESQPCTRCSARARRRCRSPRPSPSSATCSGPRARSRRS